MRPMGSRYGKKAYVNGLLIALNVLFFLYLEITGSSEDAYFMYTKGAMFAPHTIATGNMTPSFRVMKDGTIRPVYLYTVDADEFVVNKLMDRGSLSATTIVTNVQDFITIIAKGLGVMK